MALKERKLKTRVLKSVKNYVKADAALISSILKPTNQKPILVQLDRQLTPRLVGELNTYGIYVRYQTSLFSKNDGGLVDIVKLWRL